MECRNFKSLIKLRFFIQYDQMIEPEARPCVLLYEAFRDIAVIGRCIAGLKLCNGRHQKMTQ
jgi:hypothetical protein